MRRKTWRLPCIALTIGLMLGMPVSAEEIIVSDPDSLTETAGTAEGDGSIDGIEDNGMGIGDAAADGDLSGLFVETGEEVISRKGETIDDARMADEERTGSGDGGSTVAIGHLYEINGVLVRNSDFPSAHYECWTYANNVYAKIWGHNFWNLFNDTENMLRNLPDEELTLTPEHLKAYVSAAPAGAALRVCDAQYLHADDGWGHSQIIISHDENGFTVFEGGLAAWPHRREAYYTWTGYCYSGWPGKYHYIKYIKWPGASPYSEGAAGGNALDLGASGEETLMTSLEETVRGLFDLVGDLVNGEAKPEEIERVTQVIEQVAEAREAETEGADSAGKEAKTEGAESAGKEAETESAESAGKEAKT